MMLSITYFDLLKSDLSSRQFKVKVNETRSYLYPILLAGVPRGSVFVPFFYLFYTDHNTYMGTFADDTVILASHEDPVTASTLL